MKMKAWSHEIVEAHVTLHWRRKRGEGACAPPLLFWWGRGAMVCLCPPPPPHTHTRLTPHFYFLLDLYVCITLTNNYLAFFINQLIILWTISINWHRWMLLNNHTSKYNSFTLVLLPNVHNKLRVCLNPPPPPTHTHTHFLAPSYATALGQKIFWDTQVGLNNMLMVSNSYNAMIEADLHLTSEAMYFLGNVAFRRPITKY